MDISPLITLKARDADVGTAVVSGDVSDDGQITVRFSDAFELTVDAPRLRQLLGYLLPAAAAPLSATLEQTAEPAQVVLTGMAGFHRSMVSGAVDAAVRTLVARVPGCRVKTVLEIDPDAVEDAAQALGREYREDVDAAYRRAVEAIYEALPPPAQGVRAL